MNHFFQALSKMDREFCVWEKERTKTSHGVARRNPFLMFYVSHWSLPLLREYPALPLALIPSVSLLFFIYIFFGNPYIVSYNLTICIKSIGTNGATARLCLFQVVSRLGNCEITTARSPTTYWLWYFFFFLLYEYVLTVVLVCATTQYSNYIAKAKEWHFHVDVSIQHSKPAV